MNTGSASDISVFVTSPHRWGPGKIHRADCRHVQSSPGKWMTLGQAALLTNDAGKPIPLCLLCHPKKGA